MNFSISEILEKNSTFLEKEIFNFVLMHDVVLLAK